MLATGCWRVESRGIDLHPIKRARTTFTYLAVAIAGSDAQKAAFRRAVNRAHAELYSTPESPLQYNAFDPELQLWVAACPYKGAVDVYRTFVGEMDDEDAERHYREGMTLGTTLQVPPRCGRRIGRHLTSTGRSRWKRCTSTTPSASTCIRSRWPGCPAWQCRRRCGGYRRVSRC